MATPFTNDHRLDEIRVRELIEWYLEAGAHGISVAGSQGEFFALDFDECVRLIEIAAKTINGRVPLYAGTGGVTTRETIRLTQIAESAGADLALVITPYFVQPSQDELVAHYTAVASATKLPVMLYNNPPRTSVNVLPRTLARCMEAPNVVGIKDSSGDLTQSIEYLLLTGGKAILFSGRDTIFLAMLLHGAAGTISPAANVFPKLVIRMYNAARVGDWKVARRINDLLAPLRAAWTLGSFPVVIKEAMALVGQSAGPARPPISGLPPQKLAELKAVVDKIRQEEREEI